MKTLPSLDDVQKELSSIESELTRLQGRKLVLLKYRDAAKAVLSNNGHYPDLPAPHIDADGSREQNPTLDLIYRILSSVESLGPTRLIKLMREAGWQGSGDEKKDFYRINKMLVRHRGRKFRTIDRGLWVAIRPEDSVETPAE